MLAKLRARRPGHGTVVAYLALFIALGGSSYAAVRVTTRNVPANALTGADIKNLTGKDVTNNSLTRADVKNLGTGDVANGSLLAEDFKAGQLPTGAQGPSGETGPRGPSDMFTSFAETTAFPPPVQPSADPPDLKDVLTLDSPNGQFFIAANLVAHNTSSSTVIVRCEVAAFWTGDVVDSTQATLAPDAAGALVLSGPGEQQTSEPPSGFALYCAANAESGAGGGKVNLSDLDIDGVQVGEWH
jgi:hypothetical protein